MGNDEKNGKVKKNKKFNVSMHKKSVHQNTSHHRKPFHTHCIGSASTLGNFKMDPVQILYATRMKKNMMWKKTLTEICYAHFIRCAVHHHPFTIGVEGGEIFSRFFVQTFFLKQRDILKSHKIIQWIRKK